MRRTGRKNRPCYRINVSDSRFPRDGRLLETLGLYDPIRRDEASQITLDIERARHWLKVGAKPSETVYSIFKRKGVLEPKPYAPREREGRGKKTKTRARRDAAKTARVERKTARAKARSSTRAKAAKSKKAAAAAAAPAT